MIYQLAFCTKCIERAGLEKNVNFPGSSPRSPSCRKLKTIVLLWRHNKILFSSTSAFTLINLDRFTLNA